jgi:hypothetical protein
LFDEEDYCREAAAARIGLSLPGRGEVCYREIEYFGMGVVALMPHRRNTFHEPLVPNVHYLAADVTPNRRNGAEVAAAIREAYERHRHDEELLNFMNFLTSLLAVVGQRSTNTSQMSSTLLSAS